LIEKDYCLVSVGNTQAGLIGLKEIHPTLALIVNGKVKSKGNIPLKLSGQKWLEEEKG
jgi:hypothetical protein